MNEVPKETQRRQLLLEEYSYLTKQCEEKRKKIADAGLNIDELMGMEELVKLAKLQRDTGANRATVECIAVAHSSRQRDMSTSFKIKELIEKQKKETVNMNDTNAYIINALKSETNSIKDINKFFKQSAVNRVKLSNTSKLSIEKPPVIDETMSMIAEHQEQVEQKEKKNKKKSKK